MFLQIRSVIIKITVVSINDGGFTYLSTVKLITVEQRTFQMSSDTATTTAGRKRAFLSSVHNLLVTLSTLIPVGEGGSGLDCEKDRRRLFLALFSSHSVWGHSLYGTGS